ncbi:lipoprotein-releasing ABC transporter permease subunit [Indioceanicola profundi]|uniref:lipoprotein-releasing ABC transporter permease subunit n=1 Tax=Indioceanicola profundi TaxID=2220096 RepID=UPI001CEDDBB7|nr:lipoprotein-releasing ABC transporter permease subunit [Indioceanicola profundi]
MADAMNKVGIFSAAERMIAFRYLRARRQEGFISVIAGFSFLGIVLGVATLIVTLAVFNGFSKDLLARILSFQGHVLVHGMGEPIADYRGYADRLTGLPGVTAVTASLDRPALLSYRDLSAGVAVKGIRAEDIERRAVFADAIEEGSFPEADGIVIGRRLADQGGIKLGDRVTILSPQSGGEGAVPRSRAYPVTGIFQLGVTQIDGGVVLMRMQDAQALFETGDRASTLEVYLADPSNPGPARDAVDAALPPDVAVLDWRQINGSFFGFIETQRNVVSLILGLIVLVAALNIISGMIMMVQDKGREIAILRTMGATRGMIMRIFFMSGASIGVLGTVAGVVLGVVVAGNVEGLRQAVQALTGTDLFNADIYFLSELPSDVDPWQVAQVALMAVGLCFLATLYPSWRAARLEPVEVLRHE